MDAAPQFDKFTGQARRAVWLAYQEAQRFDHDYLASEHLLAGLFREGSAEITRVFRDQDIHPDDVIEKLEMTLAQAQPGPDARSIFLTPCAKLALTAAVDLARHADPPFANATHILLAMLTDSENSIREFLEDLGFDAARGEKWLREAAAAPNRDLLVKAAPTIGDGARIDPTAAQLNQLLAGQSPRVDLKADEDAAAINPALAETDYQLFLTQLILALTLGLAGGYLAFESVDAMVGTAVLLAVAACFRNSLIGMILGGSLGASIAQRIPNNFGLDTPIGVLAPLVIVGAFIGSFFGNYWRRFCPTYLRPSITHQKPPGVV